MGITSIYEPLTKPDRVLDPKRPPMVPGGTFQGTGAQLTIWATEYNQRIAANKTPKAAAKAAARHLFLDCTMHDLGQLGYFGDPGNTYGEPAGFSFQPGQLFPAPAGGIIPSDVFTGLDLAIAIISKIPAEWAQVLDLVLELLELVLDVVNFIYSLFAGKPTYLDTQLVANRFLSGQNPASFVAGVQLMRNLSQNSIYLSSSDPSDQTILGNIRRQAEEMLVAQGQTDAVAHDLIEYVWGSANQTDFELPKILKDAPQQPGGGGGNGGGGQGPCPPFTTLPSCLPSQPATDPSNDTPADLLAALDYWLMIIAIYLMNLFQVANGQPGGGGGNGGSGGGGGNSDPVTCAQLTALIGNVVTALDAIAAAEPAGTGAPADPVTCAQLSALFQALIAGMGTLAMNVTAELQQIANAIDRLAGSTPIDLSHLNAAADQYVENVAGSTATVAGLTLLMQTLTAELGQGQP